MIEFDSSYPYLMTSDQHLFYKFVGPNAGYHPDNSILTFLGKSERPAESGFVEAQRAAALVAENMPGPLWLWLSGGVDSEAMAQAFIAKKIPFKVAIGRYNKGLNDFDIIWAIEFCKKQNLPYEMIDLDLDHFYESGRHGHLADLYRCRSPQFTAHFEMMMQVDGTSLMPWQPPKATPQLNRYVTLGFPDDHYFSYARFLTVEKKPGAPYFFLYTPTLISSFLQTEAMRTVLRDGRLSGSEYDLKMKVYEQAGFKLQRRPEKWTGFEKVKQHFAERYQSDRSVFDRLYRYPYEMKYPFPKEALCSIPKSYFHWQETQRESSFYFPPATVQ